MSSVTKSTLAFAAARRFVACEGMPQLAAAAGKPVFVLGASAGGHFALMTGLRLPRKDVLGIVSVSDAPMLVCDRAAIAPVTVSGQ